MARFDQRGSVLSFIVVGIALTALLVGGIFVVKQKMIPFPGINTTEVAIDTTSEDQSSEQSSEQNSVTEPSSQSTAPENQSTTDQQTTDSTSTQQSSNNEQQSTTNQSSSESEQTTANESSQESIPQTGVSTGELPKTGPSETVSSIIALGVLGGLFAMYRRSERAKV